MWDCNSSSAFDRSEKINTSMDFSAITEANCLDQPADESLVHGWNGPRVLRVDRAKCNDAKAERVLARRHIPEKMLRDLIDGRD